MDKCIAKEVELAELLKPDPDTDAATRRYLLELAPSIKAKLLMNAKAHLDGGSLGKASIGLSLRS